MPRLARVTTLAELASLVSDASPRLEGVAVRTPLQRSARLSEATTPLMATAAATSRALHSSRIRCTRATSTPR